MYQVISRVKKYERRQLGIILQQRFKNMCNKTFEDNSWELECDLDHLKTQ